VGEKRNAFQDILVVKPGGKRLLVKSRLRWKGNIEAGLKEMGNVNWIHLAPFHFWALQSSSI
jgi:hypothetical protein